MVVSSLTCQSWQHIMKNAHDKCQRIKKCTSQSGQDVVLNATFNYFGVTNKQCVEFGFGYGTQEEVDGLTRDWSSDVCSSDLLNVQHLMRRGFKPTFFDATLSGPHVGLVKATLTRRTIGDSFKAAGIPLEVDYVSIDVDSIDIWLLLGMLESGYRPRVFSVEFNSHFAFNEHITSVEEWSEWDGSLIYGASAGAINSVATKYGYSLVHVEQRLDVFFVRNDVLKSKGCTVPAAEVLYSGHTIKHHKQTTAVRANQQLVDFDLAYEGRLQEAHSKAMEIVRNAPNRANSSEQFSLLNEESEKIDM